jgi:hypothetical protein
MYKNINPINCVKINGVGAPHTDDKKKKNNYILTS